MFKTISLGVGPANRLIAQAQVTRSNLNEGEPVHGCRGREQFVCLIASTFNKGMAKHTSSAPFDSTAPVPEPVASQLTPQVVQELRPWLHARHEQVVAGPRARHVEQLPLSLVNLAEVAVVTDLLDTAL